VTTQPSANDARKKQSSLAREGGHPQSWRIECVADPPLSAKFARFNTVLTERSILLNRRNSNLKILLEKGWLQPVKPKRIFGHECCCLVKGFPIQEKERLINCMAADNEVLTVKEVSDLMQVHPSTLYKLVRQGSIPSFRVGTDWRFRRDVIERWTVEQSMYAHRVRKVIETGVNGEARHRRGAALRGTKR
jgi:excisionase family DNA binding protein